MRRIAIYVALIVLTTVCGSCVTEKASGALEIVLVRVPPMLNGLETAAERYCGFNEWRYGARGDERSIIAFCRGTSRLPNDGLPLQIRLSKNGEIRLNNEQIGTTKDLPGLTKKLSQLFSDRTINGIFEPNSDRIEKAVMLLPEADTTYSQVFETAAALRDSGAEPLILLPESVLLTPIQP